MLGDVKSLSRPDCLLNEESKRRDVGHEIVSSLGKKRGRLVALEP